MGKTTTTCPIKSRNEKNKPYMKTGAFFAPNIYIIYNIGGFFCHPSIHPSIHFIAMVWFGLVWFLAVKIMR
jgi:hypothetical protein